MYITRMHHKRQKGEKKIEKVQMRNLPQRQAYRDSQTEAMRQTDRQTKLQESCANKQGTETECIERQTEDGLTDRQTYAQKESH